MLKNRYAYPAIFSYDDDGISIEFPDLPGCCPCADKDDTDMAIRNAREALGLHTFRLLSLVLKPLPCQLNRELMKNLGLQQCL